MQNLYLNGEVVSAAQARIDPSDRGFLLGDGIFETMQSYAGQVIFIQKHWDRLVNSAKVLQLSLPLTLDKLKEIAAQLIEVNGLQTVSASLRLTITRGCGPRGVVPPLNSQPTVLLTVAALQAPNDRDLSLSISSIRRNEYSPLVNIKSINYLDNILARMDAVNLGADDAMLLNTKGNVSETTSANIFIVKENILYTPPISDGVLPGIMRSMVIELVKTADIEIYEKSFNLNDVLDADEVFITNSILGLKNIGKIEKREFNRPVECRLATKVLMLLDGYIKKRILKNEKSN